MVEHGGEHDGAGRIHRRDDGDERQQAFPGRQQVAHVGDDGEGTGAGPPSRPARPTLRTSVLVTTAAPTTSGDGWSADRCSSSRNRPASLRAVEEHEEQAEHGAGEGRRGRHVRRSVGRSARPSTPLMRATATMAMATPVIRQHRRSLTERDADGEGDECADHHGDRRHHGHRAGGQGEVEGGDRR